MWRKRIQYLLTNNLQKKFLFLLLFLSIVFSLGSNPLYDPEKIINAIYNFPESSKLQGGKKALSEEVQKVVKKLQELKISKFKIDKDVSPLFFQRVCEYAYPILYDPEAHYIIGYLKDLRKRPVKEIWTYKGVGIAILSN